MIRALISAAVLLWASLAAPIVGRAGEVPQAGFVGRAVCAGCHAGEAALWQGSHHDMAMQEATERTVLGDFANATITHFGVTSTFFRKDGKFVVRTDGPDGELQDYEIAYTFGVYPLQQYLIAFPGGRYQALGLRLGQPAGGRRRPALVPSLSQGGDPGRRMRCIGPG